MVFVALAFILPVSECDLNLSTSQKGILTGIPYIGIICSSHLWGSSTCPNLNFKTKFCLQLILNDVRRLSSGHDGTPTHHSTIAIYGFCNDFCGIFFIEFLLFCNAEIPQRIFVSLSHSSISFPIFIEYLCIAVSPDQHRQFMRILVNFTTVRTAIELLWERQWCTEYYAF